MKDFIKKSLLFVIPFVLIILINLSIDNAYIFRNKKTYDKIGSLIAEGNNISNLYNYNEFLARKYAIKHMTETPNILCLGSSRVMQINSTIFKEKFFNMGVSAITLKELIATYNVIYEEEVKPELIIIGIDPSFFLKSKSSLRDYFIDDFNSLTKKLNLKNKVNIKYSKDKYLELINPVYCYENLKYGKKEYHLTKELFIDEPVFCFDGSYIYNRKKRNQTEIEIELEAKSQYDEFFLKRFSNMEMDEELQFLFENFVSELNQNHEVVFFLAPFHPSFADKFELEELKVIMDVENYLNSFSTISAINLLGSFDPKNIEVIIKPYDFYDGVHIKRHAVEKLFKNYFNQESKMY